MIEKFDAKETGRKILKWTLIGVLAVIGVDWVLDHVAGDVATVID